MIWLKNNFQIFWFLGFTAKVAKYFDSCKWIVDILIMKWGNLLKNIFIR